MLDLRRRRPVSRAFGPVAAGVWDRLVASDPGLLRLLMAVRGTLSVLLTTLASMAAGHVMGAPVLEFAPGITYALMGPFLTREPTWRQRLGGLVLLTVPAAGTAVATTWLHGRGPLGDGLFLLLVFVGFLFGARGPRWIGVGLVAVIVAYVGLFLELPVRSWPVQVFSVALGGVVTAVTSLVLVPLRPAWTLRRMVRAVQVRAAGVLRDAAGADAARPGSLRRLRGSLARLNEAALAADDQVGVLGASNTAALRRHMMDLELAAARLAISPMAAGAAGRRQAAGLALHARRLRLDRWAAAHRRGGDGGGRPAFAGSLADIAGAAAALGREAARAATGHATAGPAAAAGPLGWRIATRVTLASALAMAGGMAVSPQRWFWAVITTYVVFLNTRSRGDTVRKGLERLAGTLLGLFAGTALADGLRDAPGLQTAVLLAAVFGMYYLFFVSYTAGILCVTVLLGLLYDLLGVAPGPLLVLRMEETAVGAAAAFAVAAFVLPVRTRDQVERSGGAVLRALAAAVEACRCVLAGEAGVAPTAAMRALDRQVADLRLALLPLTARRLVLRRVERPRAAGALLESVGWVRMLAVAAQGPDAAGAEVAARIGERVARLAAGERGAPGWAGAGVEGVGEPVRAALAGLEGAIAALAERLAIGALQAFELEG